MRLGWLLFGAATLASVVIAEALLNMKGLTYFLFYVFLVPGMLLGQWTGAGSHEILISGGFWGAIVLAGFGFSRWRRA